MNVQPPYQVVKQHSTNSKFKHVEQEVIILEGVLCEAKQYNKTLNKILTTLLHVTENLPGERRRTDVECSFKEGV